MIFSCEPGAGNTMLPACRLGSRRVAVRGTVVVTGGAHRTTVDAAVVAGFDGTTGL